MELHLNEERVEKEERLEVFRVGWGGDVEMTEGWQARRVFPDPGEACEESDMSQHGQKTIINVARG